MTDDNIAAGTLSDHIAEVTLQRAAEFPASAAVLNTIPPSTGNLGILDGVRSKKHKNNLQANTLPSANDNAAVEGETSSDGDDDDRDDDVSSAINKTARNSEAYIVHDDDDDGDDEANKIPPSLGQSSIKRVGEQRGKC